MKCETVDELAAAYAVGAVEPSEERAIGTHLRACDQPHTEARAVIDAAHVVPLSVDEVAPPRALRARLMTTIAKTSQDHQAVADVRTGQRPAGRPWWRISALTAAGAAAVLALVVGLGAWNVTLQQQLAQREAALRAVAAADAAHPVSGAAGSGWLLQSEDATVFVAERLAALPQNRIYELWLIEPDGSPVAVGTIDRVDGVIVVSLERRLADAAAFAVTVEAERVDAPTSEPVLIASLEG